MRCLALFLVVPLLSSCGGNPSGPEGSGAPVSIRISPNSASLVYLDDQVQLVAEALDSRGGVVANVPITWQSDHPEVVSVSPSGLVTAVGGGSATVRASGSGLSGSSLVRVTGETDMAFLRTSWEGEAVFHAPDGLVTLPLVGLGTSEVAGSATRMALSIGGGEEAREVVLLAGTKAAIGDWVVALADGYRGTFATVQGDFSQGSASFESLERLGEGQRERLVFSDFREASFALRIEVSEDEGGSWSPVWTMNLEQGSTPMPPSTASPACAPVQYSEFDFWLGQWAVTNAAGNSAGSNRIERVASSCGVQENYRDPAGNTGISLNMYDPRSSKWTQIYMTSQGGVLELSGELQGEDMVLSGLRDPAGNLLDQVRWTPREDGSVRQHWQTSTGGAGWVTFFDGIYTRTQ